MGVEQIFITSGAIAGIDYCFKIFTKPNIKLGLLKPDWPGFKHYADFYRTQQYYLDNFEFPFVINAEEISNFVQEKELDMMVFANPVPVQGHHILSLDIEVLIKKNPQTLFVVDEADVVGHSFQAAYLTSQYKNVIFLGSFSKFYGLSGLRAGYVVVPKKYSKAFENTINVIEVSSLAVLAGNIVLDDKEYQNNTHKNVTLSSKYYRKLVKGQLIIFQEPNSALELIYFQKQKIQQRS